MDINTLVKTVKEYADIVSSEAVDKAAQIAVIADAKGKLYSAVTAVSVKDGKVTNISADYLAALYMINDGSRIAKSIAVALLSDKSIVNPSAECLELLFRTNPENDNCCAALSDSEASAVSALRLGGSGAELMDGFDFDDTEEPQTQTAPKTQEVSAAEEPSEPAVKANAPAQASDVISGVQIEENNPFYEAPSDVKPPEEIIATVSGENLEASVLEKEAEEEEPELTKEELLKQAKKRKKVAKANFLFRKRH